MDGFYDNGWRMGTFHKCNGAPRLNPADFDDLPENVEYFMGYNDAYDSNERRI